MSDKAADIERNSDDDDDDDDDDGDDNTITYLSQYLTNLMHKICFKLSFISCLYMFRAHASCTRRPPVVVMIPEAV